MRFVIGMLCATALLVGCAKTKEVSPAELLRAGKPVMAPDFRPTGKVQSVNQDAKFVVVSFLITDMPQPGRKMSLYRDGLKVGEIRITDVQRDGSVVADIIAGDAMVKDEARVE